MMIIISTFANKTKQFKTLFYKREEKVDYDISFILFNNYIGETCS
jgi:hypothetical protein